MKRFRGVRAATREGTPDPSPEPSRHLQSPSSTLRNAHMNMVKYTLAVSLIGRRLTRLAHLSLLSTPDALGTLRSRAFLDRSPPRERSTNREQHKITAAVLVRLDKTGHLKSVSAICNGVLQ
ncbi:hypothetical protein FRC03_003947 [Tulasnella sp. 419]|nr:hypothetical protein FRC03_003947 [Tulasnella sp. 419]